MQAPDVGVEVLVHLDLVGVELQLGAVKQGLVGGKAGHDHIQHLDELDDVGHGTVRHGGGDITGHGILQGGFDIGLRQLLGPGALAVQNVAVALDQDVARAQHVGQLTHLLGVGDGLVEGLSEVVGDEDGQVGVLALLLLEAVAIDHGQIVVVVLLSHKAAGILAEGAHLVLPGLGVADEFGLVQHLVHLFHDLVAALHAHADVNGAGLVGDVVLGADLLQPVGTAAARADDHSIGINSMGFLVLGSLDEHALALLVLQDDVLTLGAEQHLHTVVGQIVLDGQIQLLGLLGAQMTDGAVHQLQAGVDGVLADLLDVLAGVDALHMGVGTELEVDLIGVMDELLCELLANQGGQVAAHLIGKAQLAVRERASTGEAGGNGAGGTAIDAVAQLGLGAVALFHRLALFHQQDLFLAAVAQQLYSGEDAGRTGTHNDQIVFFHL